jgi:tetratricopeptide (TPR) repeat protein
MKLVVLFIFCLCFTKSFCQQRGGKVESAKTNFNGKTYALIVGVSKYKNPNIPDLKYADVDALMFKEYLMSTGVSEDNIYSLINEQATNASFWSTLNFLSEQFKDGDRFYIYFSGHGDVENKTIVQDAYLLPYDSPYSVYPMGAIGVVYLKSWIATFSSKGVKTIFIADACRSGNLIGGREGLEATATILKDKWVDEIKIVSCQPGELSLEGEQWGGGRGLFSFELINGLTGFADRNNDGKVSLRELNLYLLETVPEKAGRNPQNPMLFGNYESIISEADINLQKTFSEHSQFNLIISKGLKEAENNQINLRGVEIVIKENKDIEVSRKFNEIRKNIEINNIISLYGPNAYSLYNDFRKSNPSEIDLLETSKLLITEKVLKNVQNFVLFVLGDLSKSEFNPKNIGEISFQASILREIVGDEKLIESGNFSRILFAEACRSIRWLVFQKELLMPKEVAMAKIDTAIAFEKGAVYLNCLKGMILEFEFGDSEAAIKQYEMALEINPNFRIARNQLLPRLLEQNKFRSILNHTSVSNGSAIENSHRYLAYKELNIPDSAEIYFTKILSSSHSPIHPAKEFEVNTEFGAFFLLKANDPEKATLFFEKALNSFHRAASDTSDHIWSLLEDLSSIHYNLACCYAILNQPDLALKNLNFSINYGLSDFDWLMSDKDLESLRKSKAFSSMLKNNFTYCYNMACKHSLNDDVQKSRKYLKYAFQAGFSDFERIMKDSDLANLKRQTNLESMIRRYQKKSIQTVN